jgi:hypothetical protein|nr:MAG TPA: hypothetical protein [Caudoviricetes sp.]
MTEENYQRAEVIRQDLKALTYCTIPSFCFNRIKARI